MGIFDSIKEKMGLSSDPQKVPSAIDQPKEDQELVSFVRNRIEESRSSVNRISHEGIWMTNIAYTLGFDSVYYDPKLRQFRPAGQGKPGYIRRNRIHANLILPGMQNRTARMIKNPPKYEVRPNSMEEDDKEAARKGLDVIWHVWDQQKINRKRIELAMWKQQCGHAYVKVSHDDTLGDPIIDPNTEEIIGFTGSHRIDVCSPFECFSDPLAKTFDECSWFAQAKVRKLDYFRQHYPERGQMVKEEGAWLLSAQYEMRINTLNTVGPSSSGTSEQMKNAAIEISFYEKRSKKHPRGRHVVVANGILLKNDDLPYGEIPFSKFDDVVVGGKYFSESLVTHARPIQDQYNQVLSKRSAWVNKCLHGKFIAAKNHGLMQQAINDQSGEIVEYDPQPNAPEPKAMDVPIMPSYAYTETDQLKKELYDIMGLSEVSRGNIPSASIPGIGIQILLEQDETRLGVEVEQDEHSWARVGELILKCADANWEMDRDIKKRAENGNYSIEKINGKSLRKNFDVTVVRGSTTPNVKALYRQEIMNAYGNGLLGDPNDPSVRTMVLGMMEYGEIGEVWVDYHLDMKQIQKTIDQIEMEETPEVSKPDNHALHYLIKNRYRKSEKFEALSPIAKEIFLRDMDLHAQAGAALLNPQLSQPPDNGPPPELMLEELNKQAAGMGIESSGLEGDNIPMGVA